MSVLPPVVVENLEVPSLASERQGHSWVLVRRKHGEVSVPVPYTTTVRTQDTVRETSCL